MKLSIAGVTYKSFATLLMLIAVQAVTFAQDGEGSGVSKSVTTHSSTSSTTWYAQPWVWVVGAAVLILLLIALLRGNSGGGASRTDRVTVTKTSSTDADV